MIPIEYFLVLGAILFVIGVCIELMLNAANINFVAFGAFNGDIVGQAFVVMTISVAAAEVAVGIAILLNAYKLRKTNDLDDAELTSMRW